MEQQYIIINNMGGGVESIAKTLQWIYDPTSRPKDPSKGKPVDLFQIISFFACTGLEFRSTKAQIEDVLFPAMRSHNMRFIQLARCGPNFADGVMIVDDSTQPEVCYCTPEDANAKGYFTLGDEFDDAGVLPKLGRPHTCAKKFKGFPLDEGISLFEYLAKVWGAWSIPQLETEMFQVLAEQRQHYATVAKNHKKSDLFSNLGSDWRQHLTEVRTSRGNLTTFDPLPLLAGPVLHYNADEQDRIKTSDEFGCRGNNYIYSSMHDTRSELLDIGRKYGKGVTLKKSACCECPFPDFEYLRDRMSDPAEWDEYSRVIVREWQTLTMNANMHLYGWGTAHWFATHYAPGALDLANQRLENISKFQVMRVRRTVKQVPAPTDSNPIRWRKNSSRCVETIFEGSLIDCNFELNKLGAVEYFESACLDELKYRAMPARTKAMSKSERRDRTMAGEDLRGEPYIGCRVSKAKRKQFTCFATPIVWVHRRNLLKWPRAEECYVIVPAYIQEKVVNAQRFEIEWDELLGYGQQCLF